jgi:hypothetical protein
MTEDVDVVTELVLTGNVPLVTPDAIVTLVGTVAAAVLLLVSVIVAPDAGAAAFNVTVPCDGFPPTTLLGFNVTELTNAAAATESVAGSVTPAYAPEIVEVVDVVTELVVIGNVALVAPDAIVTLAGTVAAAVLLLVSVTVIPDDGAAELTVTVPCEGFPPTTLVGFSVKDVRTGTGAELLARTFNSAIEVYWFPFTSLSARNSTYRPVVVGNSTCIAAGTEAPGQPNFAEP